MTTEDPSRDPELTHHYVSHALLKARFALELQKPVETQRKYLIEKLERLDEYGSKTHFELSRKCLDYVSKNGEWKTTEDVEKFAEEYEKLRLGMLGVDPVAEFLKQNKISQ